MGIENVATGLYEGLTLQELKYRCLDGLKIDRDRSNRYDKYKEASITAALNDAQMEWAKRTRCLKSFAIIELKSGYSQYKPPSEMILPERAFFYQSGTSYYELDLKTKNHLDIYVPGWRIVSGDPLIMYPGENYGNLRKLGFYPTPDTDGDSYTLSPDTGVYASSTGVTSTGNVTGQNSAASATVCTDSAGRTLSSLGVTVGLTAVNVTDGSKGQISAVSGSTFTLTLAGGTANTWAIGDSFMVLVGEYGVVTSWANDEQYLFSADIGAMIDISTLTNNVLLEFVKRPLILQFDTQYPEISPESHMYLPDYVVWKLKRSNPRKSEDYADAMTGKAAFEEGLSMFTPQEASMADSVCIRSVL